MRFGINIDGGSDFGELLAKVRQVREAGFDSAWLPQSPGGGPAGRGNRSNRRGRHTLFGFDSLTALAVAGQHVNGIELGTNIVPTFPRHPMALAEQALTLRATYPGPMVLGIGVSHRHAVEDQWGYRYDRTALRMREYLHVLGELFTTGVVDFDGETVRANGSLTIPPQDPFPVLVAALGPRMIEAAGELSDGAITWMTGHRTIAEHVAPTLTAAANRAGRASPRLVAMMPVCVTDDVEAARERAKRVYLIYRSLPNYRAVLDREGAEDSADIALLGDEDTVAAQVKQLADAGATDLDAMLFGPEEDQARTRALLADLARTT
ncbi:TIGR03564 family F420-dependent LLM class oxidoreductase [Amycolatopsis nigrescens]|uniref:TIGR03564 family F420-dependent LLM class oxidoreductase n=1 Tax=Amycolatopsis nigrescens TaxID=381445 RepID=UPI000367B545|nr:TIGR03564 family F420-dependent LLM class oxidoreductase [Amycolatopsis nigrescens]